MIALLLTVILTLSPAAAAYADSPNGDSGSGTDIENVGSGIEGSEGEAEASSDTDDVPDEGNKDGDAGTGNGDAGSEDNAADPAGNGTDDEGSDSSVSDDDPDDPAQTDPASVSANEDDWIINRFNDGDEATVSANTKFRNEKYYVVSANGMVEYNDEDGYVPITGDGNKDHELFSAFYNDMQYERQGGK
jgi:hypothetical protein